MGPGPRPIRPHFVCMELAKIGQKIWGPPLNQILDPSLCIYRLVMISIKWSETAQNNAPANEDIIVTQSLRYHMPLLYFVCNHLIIFLIGYITFLTNQISSSRFIHSQITKEIIQHQNKNVINQISQNLLYQYNTFST